MNIRTGAVAIVVRNFPEGKKFLIGLNAKYDNKFLGGKWGIIGGHKEPGEEVQVASERELLEETGLRGRATLLLDVYHRASFIGNELRDTVVYYFIIEEEDPTQEPVPGQDIEETRFVTAVEFAELIGDRVEQSRIPPAIWKYLLAL